MRVVEVFDESLAVASGARHNDVITYVNNKPTPNLKVFRALWEAAGAGKVFATVYRKDIGVLKLTFYR